VHDTNNNSDEGCINSVTKDDRLNITIIPLGNVDTTRWIVHDKQNKVE
jgi:hypothetical protein